MLDGLKKAYAKMKQDNLDKNAIKKALGGDYDGAVEQVRKGADPNRSFVDEVWSSSGVPLITAMPFRMLNVGFLTLDAGETERLRDLLDLGLKPTLEMPENESSSPRSLRDYAASLGNTEAVALCGRGAKESKENKPKTKLSL